MNPPALIAVRVEELPAAVRAEAPGAAWFRVERSGTYAGRSWRAGELIACAGRAGVDDTVVLVPAGRGVPRFGCVRREGLRGEVGEACDARRWSPAGRVVRVLPGVGAPPAREVPSPVLQFRRRPAQLALFAAA